MNLKRGDYKQGRIMDRLFGEEALIIVFYMASEESKTMNDVSVTSLLGQLKEDGLPVDSRASAILNDLNGVEARGFVEFVSGYDPASGKRNFLSYYQFNKQADTSLKDYASKLVKSLPQEYKETIKRRLKQSDY